MSLSMLSEQSSDGATKKKHRNNALRYQPLASLLNDHARRQALINDCVTLTETQVGQKTGLYGIAVKTAFATIQRLSPRVVYKAMDALIDDLAGCLEPFIEQKPSDIVSTFTENTDAICEKLLEVSDNRVKNLDVDLVQSIYRKLRPKAHQHLSPAIPDIGQLVERHMSQPPNVNSE